MKGRWLEDSGLLSGRGICIGTLGFEVAEVGRGGSESVSGVSPGMSNVTTFRIDVEFCQILLGFSSCSRMCSYLDLDPSWWRGVCGDVKDEVTNILVCVRGEKHEDEVHYLHQYQ